MSEEKSLVKQAGTAGVKGLVKSGVPELAAADFAAGHLNETGKGPIELTLDTVDKALHGDMGAIVETLTVHCNPAAAGIGFAAQAFTGKSIRESLGFGGDEGEGHEASHAESGVKPGSTPDTGKDGGKGKGHSH